MDREIGKRENADRWTGLVIFLILLICYGYFFPRWAEWNQNSRMDLTLALVEKGTFAIDDYYENTGDYAVYGDHIYTDKAPGTSLLGVPAYAAFRALARIPMVDHLLTRLSATAAFQATLREGGTGLLKDKVYFAAALYFTTFFTVSLPSALLGVMLNGFLARLGLSRALRVGLVLAYGLGTIVFPYSTVFYGHQIAAVLLFATFYLLHRLRHGELGLNVLWVAGALVGLTVLTEMPALIATGFLVLYAAWFLPRKHNLLRLLLGGLPFALLLGFYNHVCFGSPFASSYRYLGRFPEISNTGFLGFSAPNPEALWGVTFSFYRGLFPLSPFLLLAVPGFWYLFRDRQWQGEFALLLGTVLAHLALISCWYDWRGGFAIGPRNLLLILPYLTVAVGFCLRAWGSHAWGQRLFALLAVVSFALVWVASTAGQNFPPIAVRNPLVEFLWPKFRSGDIARNLGMAIGLSSWHSLLPPLLIIGGSLWVLRNLRGASHTRM